MGNRVRGFTLIELMIVVVIIAVIAAIALPNLLSSRLSANETAAIATLRSIISAQAQFQVRGAVDRDVDGVGEYGTVGELSGAAALRGTASRRLNPTLLSSAFRTISATGEFARSGYQYRMYLPDASAEGLPEGLGGVGDPNTDPDHAESMWCCYAYPSNFETSGVKTFFVNQGGELLFTTDENYSGPGTAPDPGAATQAGGNADSMTGVLATGTVGRDGNLWKAVQN